MKKEKEEEIELSPVEQRIQSSKSIVVLEIILFLLAFGMSMANLAGKELSPGLYVAVGFVVLVIIGLIFVKPNKNIVKRLKALNWLQVGMVVGALTGFGGIFGSKTEAYSSNDVTKYYYFGEMYVEGDPISETNKTFYTVLSLVFCALFILFAILSLVMFIKNSKIKKTFAEEITSEKQAKLDKIAEKKQESEQKSMAIASEKQAKAEAIRVEKEQQLAIKQAKDKEAEEKRQEANFNKLKESYMLKAQKAGDEAISTLSEEELRKKVLEYEEAERVEQEKLRLKKVEERKERKRQRKEANRITESFSTYTLMIALIGVFGLLFLSSFGYTSTNSSTYFMPIISFLMPIMVMAVVLFGCYLTTYLKSWYKLIGLLPMVLGVFAFMFLVEGVNIGDTLIPFKLREYVGSLTAILNVSGNSSAVISVNALVSTALWSGMLIYYLYPSKMFEKTFPSFSFKRGTVARYVLSLVALLVWPALLIVTIFALVKYYYVRTEEKERAERTIKLSENNPNGEVIFADTEDIEVVIDGTTLILNCKGEKHIAPVFSLSTGYFEDKNNNIYYLKDDMVVVTGLYRPEALSTYDADEEARIACDM